MSTVAWLRLAAALAALQFVAHTAAFVRYVPAHGPAETAVVAAMQAHRFSFGGFERSYWDLYYGYGLLAAFSVLLEAVLFWPRFFFLAPIVMDAGVGASLGLAWLEASGRARPECGEAVRGGG
ncbi:MAG: hypothetical protein HY302_10505 [Opitutae bacterium]|nr:hypothetical protein [Opitutae bacterium]